MTKIIERKGQVVPKVTRALTPFEEMDHMFDRLFEGGFLRPFEMRWPEWAGFGDIQERMTRVDIIDEEDAVVVRAEVPGVEKDALDVTLTNDYLTLRGETHEEKEEKGEFLRSEMHHGTFVRTVRLPAEVKGDEAHAEFKDGILEIRLPKAEPAKRRSIKVV